MRRILSITGTRADYGLMQPVHAAIAADADLELHLLVTAMHYLPAFAPSLAQVRADALGVLHEVPTPSVGDSPREMSDAIATALVGIAATLDDLKPEVVLLQGDRGEMLAGAVAAAHMNLPVVHMSGGDVSGSIDDSVRNAISKLAHIHLPNCRESAERLVAIGEEARRIVTVGEPGLDRLLRMTPIPLAALAEELEFPAGEPFLLATLHPVTDEAEAAGAQMEVLLDALDELKIASVFTYPNSDAGGRAMLAALEARRGAPWLRIVPTLGSERYLSLVRHAAAVVGNSSSGLYDTPTLKVPAVNLGSRQTSRVRGANVVDAGFDCAEIVAAIRRVLHDPDFRAALAACENPFGDGRAAERTVAVLKALRLGHALTAKWKPSAEPIFEGPVDGL